MKKLVSFFAASTIVFICLCYKVPTEARADEGGVLDLAERLSQARDYRPQLVAVEPTKKEESDQSQDIFNYTLLSRKGAIWKYMVKWEFDQKQLTSKKTRSETGTLTIVNEGATVFEDRKATRFSWTFGGTTTFRMNLYFVPFPEGLFLIGSETYSGSNTLVERYQPPVPVLNWPLAVGNKWEYRGARVTPDGKTTDYIVSNTIVKSGPISVPAGTFEAFKLMGKESSGKSSTDWWAKNVGLLKQIQLGLTHRMVAELTSYSIPGETPQVVVRASSSSFKRDPGGPPQSGLAGAATFNLQRYSYRDGRAVDLNAGNAAWVAYFKYISQDTYAYHEDRVSYFNKENPKRPENVVQATKSPATRDDLMRKTQVDQETGVRFSLWSENPTIGEGKARCGEFKVIGEAPENLDLSDRVSVERILKKANKYMETICGVGAYYFYVSLYQPSWDIKHDNNWVVYVRFGPDFPTGHSIRIEHYQNRALERKVIAEEDAEKQRIINTRNAFAKKHGVQGWPELAEFSVNPFVYEGKIIAIKTLFAQMLSATEGLFQFNPFTGGIVVSDIPKGLLTSQAEVILAGKVIGKTGGMPHLKFVGIHICEKPGCLEIISERR